MRPAGLSACAALSAEAFGVSNAVMAVTGVERTDGLGSALLAPQCSCCSSVGAAVHLKTIRPCGAALHSPSAVAHCARKGGPAVLCCNTLCCVATWCTGRAGAGAAGDLVVRVQHERRRRRGRATRARHLCVSPSSLLTASVAASPTTPLPTDQLTQLQACSGTAMQRYGLVVAALRCNAMGWL